MCYVSYVTSKRGKGAPFGVKFGSGNSTVQFVRCCLSYCSHPSVGGGYFGLLGSFSQYHNLESGEWCFELKFEVLLL